MIQEIIIVKDKNVTITMHLLPVNPAKVSLIVIFKRQQCNTKKEQNTIKDQLKYQRKLSSKQQISSTALRQK